MNETSIPTARIETRVNATVGRRPFQPDMIQPVSDELIIEGHQDHVEWSLPGVDLSGKQELGDYQPNEIGEFVCFNISFETPAHEAEAIEAIAGVVEQIREINRRES